MTDKKQPEALAFCWATELAMTQQPVTLSVTEAREVSAKMQRLHAENETLRTGYAAARLEIESLQARIKTMAEEHADELMVAHLDGRMRAEQPAGAQQPGAVYAALSDAEIDRIVPALEPVSEDFPAEWAVWKDRERIRKELRASHWQAPAQAAPAEIRSYIAARAWVASAAQECNSHGLKT